MDKIKIIFWIIAGVLYLVGRAYKSEKNKENTKKMGKKPVSKSKIEDILKDIQKEINSQPKQQNNKPQPKPVVKNREPLKAKYEKIIEGKKYNSTEKVSHFHNNEPHLEHNEIEIIDMNNVNNENRFLEDFDAKKAIIYTEIFKRKEW